MSGQLCNLPPVPDISGIGVRVAIYAQNVFYFLPVMRIIGDGKVTIDELSVVERILTTNLIIAFAILVSAVVQASTIGLSGYHATIVLSQSWMNNTSSSIYFLLYVHHMSSTPFTIKSSWSAWWDHLVSIFKATDIEQDDDDTEEQGWFNRSRNRTGRWISKRIVIVLGSLHLSCMSGVGLWLWHNPRTFGILEGRCAIDVATIAIFGFRVSFGATALKVVSLVLYSVFSIPGFNILLPTSLFLSFYISFQRWRLPRPKSPFKHLVPRFLENWFQGLQHEPSIFPVFVCLLILLAINVVFIADIELTLLRNKAILNTEETRWDFGQILALLLLVMPLRDMLVLTTVNRRHAQRERTADLIKAINDGKIDDFLPLIRKGADVNARTAKGITALEAGFYARNWRLLNSLVNVHRVDLTVEFTRSQTTALHTTVEDDEDGQQEVLRLFLRHVKPDIQAIQIASKLGKLNMVKLLLRNFDRSNIQSEIVHSSKDLTETIIADSGTGLAKAASSAAHGGFVDVVEALKLFVTVNLAGAMGNDNIMPTTDWDYHLGIAHHRRYQTRSNDIEDVKKAIDFLKRVSTVSSTNQSTLYTHLGVAYETCSGHFSGEDGAQDLRSLAITHLARAVELTHPEDSYRPTLLYKLGKAYQKRFEETRAENVNQDGQDEQDDDLKKSIQNLKDAIKFKYDDLIPDASRPAAYALAYAYELQFQYLSSREDYDTEFLGQLLAFLRSAVESTSSQHQNYLDRRWNLGLAYEKLSLRMPESREVEYIIEATKQFDNVVASLDRRDYAKLRRVEKAYRRLYFYSLDLSDLKKAIEHLENAVKGAPPNPADHLELSITLGKCYQQCFGSSGENEDNEKVIHFLNKAAIIMESESGGDNSVFLALGHAYRARFEHSKATGDLDNAIESFLAYIRRETPDEFTLNALCETYVIRSELLVTLGRTSSALEDLKSVINLNIYGRKSPRIWNTIGIAHEHLFSHTGDTTELAAAMTAFETALDSSTSPDPLFLSNMSHIYSLYFEHTGNLGDLRKSTQLLQESLSLTPRENENSIRRQNNLGFRYLLQFEREGDPESLEKAFQLLKEAVHKYPNDPNYLDSLGVAHRLRFEHYGEPQDIKNSIETLQKAIDSTARTSHELNRSLWLNDIIVAYRCRFESEANPQDIDHAIEKYEEAVSLTSTNILRRCMLQNSVGSAYRCRFERNGNVQDIEQAIKLCQEAVESAPDGDAELPGWKANLANAYRSYFQSTKNEQHLETAIKYYQEAIGATPEDHARRPERLHGLGLAFQRRFDLHHDSADLEIAIEKFQNASDWPYNGRALRSKNFNSLGHALQLRFRTNGSFEDLEKAIEHFQKAVMSTPPSHVNRPGLFDRLSGAYKEYDQARQARGSTTFPYEFSPHIHKHQQNGTPVFGRLYRLYEDEKPGKLQRWSIFAG